MQKSFWNHIFPSIITLKNIENIFPQTAINSNLESRKNYPETSKKGLTGAMKSSISEFSDGLVSFGEPTKIHNCKKQTYDALRFGMLNALGRLMRCQKSLRVGLTRWKIG